jgi:hypothetical protein
MYVGYLKILYGTFCVFVSLSTFISCDNTDCHYHVHFVAFAIVRAFGSVYQTCPHNITLFQLHVPYEALFLKQ